MNGISKVSNCLVIVIFRDFFFFFFWLFQKTRGKVIFFLKKKILSFITREKYICVTENQK